MMGDFPGPGRDSDTSAPSTLPFQESSIFDSRLLAGRATPPPPAPPPPPTARVLQLREEVCREFAANAAAEAAAGAEHSSDGASRKGRWKLAGGMTVEGTRACRELAVGGSGRDREREHSARCSIGTPERVSETVGNTSPGLNPSLSRRLCTSALQRCWRQ